MVPCFGRCANHARQLQTNMWLHSCCNYAKFIERSLICMNFKYCFSIKTIIFHSFMIANCINFENGLLELMYSCYGKRFSVRIQKLLIIERKPAKFNASSYMYIWQTSDITTFMACLYKCMPAYYLISILKQSIWTRTLQLHIRQTIDFLVSYYF